MHFYLVITTRSLAGPGSVYSITGTDMTLFEEEEDENFLKRHLRRIMQEKEKKNT